MDTRSPQLPSPLVELLKVRYRLLWAQVRFSPGKTAFFVAGWLGTVTLVLVLGAGGISAASMATSAVQLRQIADLVLTTVFVGALVGSLAFGVGVNDVFSDSSLRRFPLSSRQRAIARHLLSLLDPTWLLVAAAEAGLAIGFCRVASTPAAVAIVVVGLLLLINYLAARVLAGLATRILSTGPGVLASMLISVAIPLAIAAGHLHRAAMTDRFPSIQVVIWTLANIWPPSLATVALAAPTPGGRLLPVGVLAAWTGVLGTALFAIERRIARSRTNRPPRKTSGESYSRLAGVFGDELAPWMGKALRYYTRSPQVRYNAVVVLLVIVQAAFGSRLRNDAALVGNVTLVGLSTAAFSLNMFGFDGPGLRRCWFLPASADTVLRAVSLCGVLLDLLLLSIVLGVIVLLTNQLAEPRLLALLAGCGVTGTFLFQALGVWTSVLAPRAIPFRAAWSHRWSMAASAVVGGGVVFAMTISFALSKRPEGWAAEHWWLGLTASGAAGLLYLVSLRTGARVLDGRREAILFEIETPR